MRSIPSLFLGLSLAACSSARPAPVTAPAPAPAAATTPTTGAIAGAATSRPDGSIEIAIPMQVGEFQYVRRQDFDDASMGTMVRYRNADGLEADVFLYPGPDLATSCPERCARKVLKGETSGFSRVMRDRDDVSRFKVLAKRDLTPGASDRWRMGHHLHATVALDSRDRRVQHTDYWIVYFPGFRMKVRSTFDETPERVAALERFLAQVVDAYTRTPAGSPAGTPAGSPAATPPLA